ncbi:DUF4025 domain-containing protein [Brevibacillus nitrificans]|uniref:DUF4025 domain-containing protein n=1 Tax=Brevibacillus nitrificans TaxID=651560 RepID=UPI00285C19A9|nr:DUF4025 domain-containing protein [Brevibacillus nitrificans]MDR7317290.1 hypothetical protein [Brevibacillus nitrificans]
MDQQQSGNTNAWNQNEAAADSENQNSQENHEGMAQTQEQVSDMYKMGTIEDRGSTR